MKYTTQDGFIWEVVSKEAATELLHSGKEVYRVYEDESESLIEMNVQLDDDNVMFYAVEYGKQWARVDSETGKGMNQGFCVNDGEAYFENESDLVKYLREQMNVDEAGDLSDEFILKEAYDNGEYYYTEWDVEDEEYYYIEKDGKLTEIWRDEQ
jgi:hypothetical protein